MARPREWERREQRGRARRRRRGIQPQHLQIVKNLTKRAQIHGLNLIGNNKKNLEKKKHTRTHNNHVATTTSGTTM
eukprot:2768487-Prorocentrum_lima.AAC.1